MTPRWRRICKPLARGSKSAFARRCLQDHAFKNAITKGKGISLRHEIARLNSDDVEAILRNKSGSHVYMYVVQLAGLVGACHVIHAVVLGGVYVRTPHQEVREPAPKGAAAYAGAMRMQTQMQMHPPKR